MDMDRFQNEVAELTKGWKDSSAEHRVPLMVMRLVEEIGELAQELTKSEGTRWGHDTEVWDEGAVQSEIGDILFILARISTMVRSSLGESAVGVLRKIHSRLDKA